MARARKPNPTERIGKLEFRVAYEPAPADPQESNERRVEALTAWLLAEWHREQQAKQEHGPAERQ